MKKARIFIVEDEIVIAKDIKRSLDKFGYSVVGTAASGERAIQRALELKPDLILMDIVLKGNMDGIEAANEIQSSLDVPIIYLTAYADKVVLDRAKATGPFGYMLKPFEDKEIFSTIEMALYKHEMEKKLKEKSEQLIDINRNLEKRVSEEIKKRRRHEQLLIQQSKLAAMGEMIAAIAHQWRQPLTSLGIIIQDIEDAYDYGELDKQLIENTVKESMKQIQFMSNTIDDFRNFFKPTKDKAPFDVLKAIRELISLITDQLRTHLIEVGISCTCTQMSFDSHESDEKEYCEHGLMTVSGYPNEFKQVVLNVINNARDAIMESRDRGILKSNDPGRITLNTSFREVDKVIVIYIRDNGPGIPDDIKDRIFEPYYTTKDEGKGTGIGLYMSKMIIENNMDGKFYIDRESDETVFVIELKKTEVIDGF